MIQRFFDVWEQEGIEDGREEMVEILEKYLHRNYRELDERNQVAGLKKDFESDLPISVVTEAVGCDRRLCRDIRWMGEKRGVVDRTGGRDAKSIAPSRRDAIREECDNRCVRCDIHDDNADGGLELHHIIPTSQGGFDHDENLTYLCPKCHIEAHAGDFSTRRTVYADKEEFWEKFVGEFEP